MSAELILMYIWLQSTGPWASVRTWAGGQRTWLCRPSTTFQLRQRHSPRPGRWRLPAGVRSSSVPCLRLCWLPCRSRGNQWCYVMAVMMDFALSPRHQRDIFNAPITLKTEHKRYIC